MRRALRWAVRITAGVLLIAVVYLGVTFAQVWRASLTDDARPADAIVVLGAAQWDGKPSPVLQERLDHAVELYEQGIAPVVVVTGGKQAGDRVTQGFAGYQYLMQQGVPESAIRIEVDGTNTYEELSASANILRSSGLGETVVLVSDPYHLERGVLIADEVGLEAFGSPSGSGSSFGSLARETGAVALGRIVSFRRLANWAA